MANGVRWGEHVEAVDLVVEGHLTLDRQPVDEIVDRLGTVGRPVVDGLEVRHGRRILGGTDKLARSRPRQSSVQAVDSTECGLMALC
jgi:hypothetical protein